MLSLHARFEKTVLGLLLTVWAGALLAQSSRETPFPGITYRHERRQDPPMRLFIAEVNLTNPRLNIRVVPGGPDPDGPGEWETTLMTPTRIAAREGFDLAVNGDFYRTAPEGWANVIGPAVSDRKRWSTSNKKRPCLVVRGRGQVSIEMIGKPANDMQQLIAGNVMLVENGKSVLRQNQDRHPRTAVGLNSKRTRLLILVVDGRSPSHSVGMRYDELADEMIRLGAKTAINLDGGGSSVMVLRDPGTQRLQVLNQPSDGQERAVANVLGITVGDGKLPPHQPPDPVPASRP